MKTFKHLKTFKQLNESEEQGITFISSTGPNGKTRIYTVGADTVKIDFDEVEMTDNVDHGYGSGYATGYDQDDNKWSIDVDCNVDGGSVGPDVDEWHDDTLEMIETAKEPEPDFNAPDQDEVRNQMVDYKKMK